MDRVLPQNSAFSYTVIPDVFRLGGILNLDFFCCLDNRHTGHPESGHHRPDEGRVHCSVPDGDRSLQAAQDTGEGFSFFLPQTTKSFRPFVDEKPGRNNKSNCGKWDRGFIGNTVVEL